MLIGPFCLLYNCCRRLGVGSSGRISCYFAGAIAGAEVMRRSWMRSRRMLSWLYPGGIRGAIGI